jgi:hypothetical protein
MLINGEIRPQFFLKLCHDWIEILNDKTTEQKFQIEALGEFRYSLAIMLIYAETLFADNNLESLKSLWKAVSYKENDCDFGNFDAMKEKGMEIMKSADHYLAYSFLDHPE